MNQFNLAIETKPLAAHRVLGTYSCGHPGPLVLATGGIHGNEPSGVLAIQSVVEQLQKTRPPFCGRFVGLTGNRRALAAQRRYVDEDLNRCFKPERVARLGTTRGCSSEEQELAEIISVLDEEAANVENVFFVDCHTTSSMTVPYISVNAHPESLHLARRFPLYSVIGLEQSIPGCFGEYCNKRNYCGFTVEGGQHNEVASVENLEAILWLLLRCSGAMFEKDISGLHDYRQSLARNIVEGNRSFNLAAHYRISPGEKFVMRPDYVNFQRVHQGEVLADNRFGPIVSPCEGRMLMPLYQSEGDDGFFLLEEEACSTAQGACNAEQPLTEAETSPELPPGFTRPD